MSKYINHEEEIIGEKEELLTPIEKKTLLAKMLEEEKASK